MEEDQHEAARPSCAPSRRSVVIINTDGTMCITSGHYLPFSIVHILGITLLWSSLVFLSFLILWRPCFQFLFADLQSQRSSYWKQSSVSVLIEAERMWNNHLNTNTVYYTCIINLKTEVTFTVIFFAGYLQSPLLLSLY